MFNLFNRRDFKSFLNFFILLQQLFGFGSTRAIVRLTSPWQLLRLIVEPCTNLLVNISVLDEQTVMMKRSIELTLEIKVVDES